MIKKVFWLGLGIAIGVIAVRKITEAQQNLGPAGVNRAVGKISDGVHDFADAIRDGMTQREGELRAALGLGNNE